MTVRAHFKHCTLRPAAFVSETQQYVWVEILFLKVLILFSLTYLGANLVHVSGISTRYQHLLSKEMFDDKNCTSFCVLGHVESH